jgi:biotin carboxyl carrier protein
MATPGWMAALNARSAGLNKKYGLPKAASKPPGATMAPAPYDPYAGAQKSVDDMLATMLASVEREKQMAYEAMQREAAMELQKGQALAEGLKALGISESVQRAFQNAGSAQAGLAQGFSGSTRELASAQAAEQQRQLSGTGQEGAVRNQGENMGNVQYGVGGFIPGTELNTIGAAFGADAALQPGFAMQFGAINEALRRQKWADEELPEWTNQKMSVYDKKAGMLADAYERVDDSLKTTSKTSDKITYRNLANGQIGVFQGGKLVRREGPARAAKTKAAAGPDYQMKDMGDYRQVWDANSNKFIGPKYAKPPKGKGTAAKPYKPELVDRGDYKQVWDANKRKFVGPKYWKTEKGSATTTAPAKRPDGMTPTQVRNARADAWAIVNGWSKNGRKDDEGNDYLPKDLLKYMIQEGGIPFDIAVRILAKKVPAAKKWYSDTKKTSVKPEKGAKIMPASFRSTHQTDNLGWPAVDIMGKAGTPVASPVSGTVVRHGSAQGGEAMYLEGDDGTMYWLGHIDYMLPVGTRVKKGQTLARIANQNVSAHHVHLAKQSGSHA